MKELSFTFPSPACIHPQTSWSSCFDCLWQHWTDLDRYSHPLLHILPSFPDIPLLDNACKHYENSCSRNTESVDFPWSKKWRYRYLESLGYCIQTLSLPALLSLICREFSSFSYSSEEGEFRSRSVLGLSLIHI